jgi:hypothetical protein
MAVATVRDLIRGSLKLIGVLAVGETPTAEELQDALSVLNDMLGSWSLESLTLFAQQIQRFGLISGMQQYTLGATGGFEAVRPTGIQTAGIEIYGSNPIEIPIRVLSQNQWANIPVKSVSGRPTAVYIDYNYPLANVYVWPVPDATPYELILYSSIAHVGFTSINDPLQLPPGYAKALRYNLAVELAPEYGRSLNEAVIAGAVEGKENIKRANIKPQYLDSDFETAKPFNWVTGE